MLNTQESIGLPSTRAQSVRALVYASSADYYNDVLSFLQRAIPGTSLTQLEWEVLLSWYMTVSASSPGSVDLDPIAAAVELWRRRYPSASNEQFLVARDQIMGKVTLPGSQPLSVSLNVSTTSARVGQPIGMSASVSSAAINPVIYDWRTGGQPDWVRSYSSAINFVYYTPGTYTAWVTVTDAANHRAQSMVVVITVTGDPVAPPIIPPPPRDPQACASARAVLVNHDPRWSTATCQEIEELICKHDCTTIGPNDPVRVALCGTGECVGVSPPSAPAVPLLSILGALVVLAIIVK